MLMMLGRVLTAIGFVLLLLGLLIYFFAFRPDWVEQPPHQSRHFIIVTADTAFDPLNREASEQKMQVQARTLIEAEVMQRARKQICKAYGMLEGEADAQLTQFLRDRMQQFPKLTPERAETYDDLMQWRSYGQYRVDAAAIDVWLQEVYMAYNAMVLEAFETEEW